MRSEQKIKEINAHKRHVKVARQKRAEFYARGSKCPICKRWFRDEDSCPHSIVQAHAKLDQNIIQAEVGLALAKGNG